jgi:hypothetical protein
MTKTNIFCCTVVGIAIAKMTENHIVLVSGICTVIILIWVICLRSKLKKLKQKGS